jgi:hypothetical protein
MQRIRSINSRRVVNAVSQPLKKKGVIIQPGSDAENVIKSGVKVANRGIRVLNRLMAEGEKMADEGRDAIRRATAPKRKTKSR